MSDTRFLSGHYRELLKPMVRSVFLPLIAVLLAMGLAACALGPRGASPQGPAIDWQSTLQTDRSLVGKIWWQKERRFVSSSELLAELAKHDVVLLGEKHDNPDHHTIEAWLIQRLAKEGGLKSIYFEMLNMEQQDVLVGLNGRPLTHELSLAELKAQLKWPDKGWSWEDYGVLIKQSFALKLSVNPANVSREVVAKFYKDPQWLEHNTPQEEAITSGLYEKIDASHCLMLKPAQIYRMIAAQTFRDKSMARQLIAGHQSRLLVAGNFHIRRDFGVPNYAPNSSEWVNIAILEVADSDDPLDYNLRNRLPLGHNALSNQSLEGVSAKANGAAGSRVTHGSEREAGVALKPFDFIWFTPRWTDRDYCKDMQPIKSE